MWFAGHNREVWEGGGDAEGVFRRFRESGARRGPPFPVTGSEVGGAELQLRRSACP
jgi:hypothetical protein